MSISNCSANVINSLFISGKYTYKSAKVRLCDVEILTMLNLSTKPSELLKCSLPTWYLNNHKKASVLAFSTAQFSYSWLTVLNHSLGGFTSMYKCKWSYRALSTYQVPVPHSYLVRNALERTQLSVLKGNWEQASNFISLLIPSTKDKQQLKLSCVHLLQYLV